MSGSMTRYFYCEMCYSPLVAEYDPAWRHFALFCPRCPGRPRRMVVADREVLTIGEEPKRQLEHILARSGLALPFADTASCDDDCDDAEEDRAPARGILAGRAGMTPVQQVTVQPGQVDPVDPNAIAKKIADAARRWAGRPQSFWELYPPSPDLVAEQEARCGG